MNFLVNRSLTQEGRGLSNIFGTLLRKSIPFFGKEVAKHGIDGLSSYIENKIDGNEDSASNAIQNIIEKSKTSAKKSLSKYAKRKLNEISDESDPVISSHKSRTSKKRKIKKRFKKIYLNNDFFRSDE